MRSTAAAALFLALLPCAGSAATSPHVECAGVRCDFGDRLPGPLPPAVFTITNRGDAALVLKPQPCCGITITGTELPIPPGQSRRLIAHAPHPLGEGLFRKTIEVLTNDPSTPDLRLEMMAMGKSPIVVTPGDELTFSLDDEVVPSQTITLRCNDEPELKITAIRCSVPYVRCKEVVPLVPDKEAPGRYRAVELSVTSAAPSTPYEAEVALETNCHRRPVVRLHVFGLSPNGIAAQPPRLDFEPLGPNETSLERVVTLTRAMGPFKLLGVTTSDPQLEVKAEMDPSDRFAQLVVSFQPRSKHESFHGALTVRTNDPQRPRFTIPVSSEAQ